MEQEERTSKPSTSVTTLPSVCSTLTSQSPSDALAGMLKLASSNVALATVTLFASILGVPCESHTTLVTSEPWRKSVSDPVIWTSTLVPRAALFGFTETMLGCAEAKAGKNINNT